MRSRFTVQAIESTRSGVDQEFILIDQSTGEVWLLKLSPLEWKKIPFQSGEEPTP